MNLYLAFKEKIPQWVLKPFLINRSNREQYIEQLKLLDPKCYYLLNGSLYPIRKDDLTPNPFDFHCLVKIDSNDDILAWEYLELDRLKQLNLKITIEVIQTVVLKELSINESDFKSNYKIRKRKYVYARNLIMVFAYALLNMSLEEVGVKVGEKDHATVLHAGRTTKQLYETKRATRINIYRIGNSLGLKSNQIEYILFGDKVKIII